MKTVLLRDGCFPDQHSATLADAAAHERPALMAWHRIGYGEGAGRSVVFTDHCLKEVITSPARRKVAWLIEPPSINPVSYQTVVALRDHFDAVITHQRDLAQRLDGFWYPFGGSRIKAEDRHFATKVGNVCIIASSKRSAPGHRLRHEVIRRYPEIDAYGPEYGGAISHASVLPRYRYAVVIENERSADWLTEKLIDCLLVGVIPIYWGAPIAPALFRSGGIWPWSEAGELGTLLQQATPERYNELIDVVLANAIRARRYICAEDWITRIYPDVWG